MCICAFQYFQSSLKKKHFYRAAFSGKVIFIILIGLRVFVNTHLLWPLSLTCAEAPKPHVNLDNGGLRDFGNCCLSVQWKERLSCNGSPVGSACKLLCTAAVWGLPPELHISVLAWLVVWLGWDQFIWRLALLLVKVSQCVCCIHWLRWGGRISKGKVYPCCCVSDCKLSLEYIQLPRLQLFRG